jgi:hypothetical protein
MLSHAGGIRRILVEGAEVCIQQVCWICEARMPSPGPYVVSLEVRNPLETAEEITLARTLVGLDGWEVNMLDGVGLGGGDAAEVEVTLLPPPLEEYGTWFVGDESYLKVWAYASDDRLIGGAWIRVSR